MATLLVPPDSVLIVAHAVLPIPLAKMARSASARRLFIESLPEEYEGVDPGATFERLLYLRKTKMFSKARRF